MSPTDTPLENIDFRKADDDILRRYINWAETELDSVRTEHAKLSSLVESLKDEAFKRFKEAGCKPSPQSA